MCAAATILFLFLLLTQKRVFVVRNLWIRRRRRYYSGIVAFRQQRWADAAADFEASLKLKCLSPVEQDFCDFITEEAKQGAIEARALATNDSKSRA